MLNMCCRPSLEFLVTTWKRATPFLEANLGLESVWPALQIQQLVLYIQYYSMCLFLTIYHQIYFDTLPISRLGKSFINHKCHIRDSCCVAVQWFRNLRKDGKWIFCFLQEPQQKKRETDARRRWLAGNCFTLCSRLLLWNPACLFKGYRRTHSLLLEFPWFVQSDGLFPNSLYKGLG